MGILSSELSPFSLGVLSWLTPAAECQTMFNLSINRVCQDNVTAILKTRTTDSQHLEVKLELSAIDEEPEVYLPNDSR